MVEDLSYVLLRTIRVREGRKKRGKRLRVTQSLS